MILKNLGTIALASIDLEKLSSGILDEILEPALLAAVEKSPNKIDDAVVAMLYPILEKELKELIAKKVAELKA